MSADDLAALRTLLADWFDGSELRPADAAEVQEAAAHQEDNHSEGDSGYAKARELTWFFVAEYPVSKLDAPDAVWFAAEVAGAAEDGRAGYYDDMLSGAIREPIVVHHHEGIGHIWDGYHRAGASVTRALPTIPAIVGLRMELLREAALSSHAPLGAEASQPVVYHGTPGAFSGAPITRFERKAGSLGGALGFWFASTREAAAAFAKPRFAGVTPQIISAQLAVTNPKEFRGHSELLAAANARIGPTIEARLKSLRRHLAQRGHDGIVVRDCDTDGAGVRDDWVAFDASQVRIVGRADVQLKPAVAARHVASSAEPPL